jgi:hypothetical protein
MRREHVAPRGGVTVLAQLTAGSFGTGWAYYAANIAVTLVLALAANTSFGGLPVLMSLLSDDNRLPHLLGLGAERPVHRYGVFGLELDLGGHPHRPLAAKSLVIVPVGSISKLTEHALHAALSLGDDIIAVSVHPEAAQSAASGPNGTAGTPECAWTPSTAAPITSPPDRRLRPAGTARQPSSRRPHPRGPATRVALPDPAEPARPAPGRQHRRRHLYHPLPAHDTIGRLLWVAQRGP